MMPVEFNHSNFDPLSYLPEETSLQVLSHLDEQSLGRCCQVSRTWRRIASDDSLWRHAAQEINTIPQGVNIKSYLDKHAVKSYDQVVRLIQEFVNRVPLNQKGEFTCVFPFSPGCTISVTLGCGEVNSRMEPHIKEICVFMRAIQDNNAALGPAALNSILISESWSPPNRFTSYTERLPQNVGTSYSEYQRIIKSLNTRVNNLANPGWLNYLYGKATSWFH